LCKLPVIGVSHTGHLNTCNTHHKQAWYKNAILDQQVDDKIKYIENKLLKSNSKKIDIILIGHSIGCYIILKMLSKIKERNLNINVKKSILIFPTIERMKISPQGKRVTPLLNYLLKFLLFVVFLVSMIPRKILEKLVKLTFNLRKNSSIVDENVVKASLHMVSSYSCVKSLLLMAKHEMNAVEKLNFEEIKNHHKDLILYYGTKDHWCPIDYYHDMKQHYENHLSDFNHSKSLLLDENNLEHAFLIDLKQTEIMSKLTAKWIKDILQ
jgi:predicted alpha/beta hydrolase family esterase